MEMYIVVFLSKTTSINTEWVRGEKDDLEENHNGCFIVHTSYFTCATI